MQTSRALVAMVMDLDRRGWWSYDIVVGNGDIISSEGESGLVVGGADRKGFRMVQLFDAKSLEREFFFAITLTNGIMNINI